MEIRSPRGKGWDSCPAGRSNASFNGVWMVQSFVSPAEWLAATAEPDPPEPQLAHIRDPL
jgi:hypothetical protein